MLGSMSPLKLILHWDSKQNAGIPAPVLRCQRSTLTNICLLEKKKQTKWGSEEMKQTEEGRKSFRVFNIVESLQIISV